MLRTLTRVLAVCSVMFPGILVPNGPLASAQAHWAVTKTFHVGGEGGWDYVTVDPTTHRLYVPRTVHTMVIDTETGKTLADIPGQKHSHGVALVPEVGRGFISDGAGAIQIFDLRTNAVLGTIPTLPDADGIIFDEATNQLLVVSGDGGALMTLAPDIDPKSGKLSPPITLGGKPEFFASDGAGKAYVNLEDKGLVAVVDLKQRKVLKRWPVAPGGHPVAMSIDKNKRLLFIGCRNPQRLIVMNADSGQILADLPIGAGVDATITDGTQVFASCRDSKLYVVNEPSPGKFEILEAVQTPEGARTMSSDPLTKTIYLPTAELEPANGSKPIPKSGTFMIVVVGQRANIGQ